MALRNLDELIQLLRQTGVAARQRAAAGLHPDAIAAAENRGTASAPAAQAAPGPRQTGTGLQSLDRLAQSATAAGTGTNRTTNPRAGQDFQDFQRGGRDYHVYNGPLGRQVFAVGGMPSNATAFGRPMHQQPDTSGQTVTDKPALDRLAAAKLQMGGQRDSSIKRRLMGQRVR